jgi:sugar phosphate permease
LAAGFGGFGFANAGFVTWAPSYLTQAHNISPELANFYVSLSPMVAIISTVIAGWAIDKLQRPRAMLVISSIITCLLYGYSFLLGSAGWIVPWMLMLGFFPGFFATTTFTLAPEAVASPQLAGLAMAVLNLLFNVGFVLGPPVVGGIVNNAQANWGAGSIPLTSALSISIATSLLFAKIMGKKPERQNESAF